MGAMTTVLLIQLLAQPIRAEVGEAVEVIVLEPLVGQV